MNFAFQAKDVRKNLNVTPKPETVYFLHLFFFFRPMGSIIVNVKRIGNCFTDNFTFFSEKMVFYNQES